MHGGPRILEPWSLAGVLGLGFRVTQSGFRGPGHEGLQLIEPMNPAAGVLFWIKILMTMGIHDWPGPLKVGRLAKQARLSGLSASRLVSQWWGLLPLHIGGEEAIKKVERGSAEPWLFWTAWETCFQNKCQWSGPSSLRPVS
jgi:hypothetical protein